MAGRTRSYAECRSTLASHLIPDDRVLEYAGRTLDDPDTRTARDAAYPWSMALANLVMLDDLIATLAGLTQWHGQRVLDAGCGPGLITHGLTGLGAAEVVGVDSNPTMLAAARALAGGSPNLELRDGDLRDLPFDDATFDVVVCGDLPLTDEIRAELSRVLRPGGTFVCKRSGIVPPCTTAWDPGLDHTMRTAMGDGMRKAGPPWSARSPGWHLRELIEESGGPPRAFTTVIGQAGAPLPDVWRHYIRQRFATFDGPFIRAGATEEDWARICDLWRPDSPEYLFGRDDAYVALPVSLVIVERPA